MRLKRILISGFKSFAKSTDLPLSPGVTAVVGPNGCGKSNLMEAIRWVMGETSAKRLRGRGMYDVVYSGNTKDGPRQVCEVELHFDPHQPDYSEKWASNEACIIKRRLVRDQGSAYSINGKACRARDVQIFFADLGAGSSSHAFVGQGQVARLIEQSSQERRHLLEEAAGARGLQVRREESLRKLNSAESNLTSLGEILAVEERQMIDLQAQAEQATRYRAISQELHALEAQTTYITWQQSRQMAEKEHQKAKKRAESIERIESEIAQVVRETEAFSETRQKLQEACEQWDHKIRLLELDIARKRTRQESARQRLATVQDHYIRLDKDLKESTARQESVSQWRIEHQSKRQKLGDPNPESQTKREFVSALIKARKELADAISERKEASQTHQAAVIAEKEQQIVNQRIGKQLDGKRRARESLEDEMERCLNLIADKHGAIKEQQQELVTLQKNLNSVRQDDTRANESQQMALTRYQEAQDNLEKVRRGEDEKKIELQHSKRSLTAEAAGYHKVVQGFGTGRKSKSLESDLQFDPELTRAVALALGIDRDAVRVSEYPPTSMENLGDHYWLPMTDHSLSIDKESTSLWDMVTAPPCMEARLRRIRLASNRAEAEALQPSLNPGESAVSKDGWYFGWDGVACHISRHSRRAQVSEAEVCLKEIQLSLSALEQTIVEEAKNSARIISQFLTIAQKVQKDLEQERDAVRQAGRQTRELEQRLIKVNGLIARLKSEVEILDDRQAHREQQYQDLQQEEKELEAESQPAKDSDNDQIRQKIQAKRQSLDEKEHAEEQSRGNLKDCEIADQRYTERQENAAAAIRDWNDRSQWIENEDQLCRNRIVDIESRLHALALEKQDMTASKADDERLEESEDNLKGMSKDRQEIINKIHHSKQQIDEFIKRNSIRQEELKEEVAHEATLRESSRQSGARAELLEQELRERSGVLPREYATSKAEQFPKSLTKLARRCEELTHIRNELGNVNLLALQESKKLETRLSERQKNITDLEDAIGKLQKGIAKIDVDAHQRMMDTLQVLEAEYARLYNWLFNGGQARLELKIEDNLWNAGLEIFAAPPGKRLRSLSLLSGGEQTLTALSLLLAVHRLSKVPFCILDEVDAALDDTNAERLIRLIVELFPATDHMCCLLVTHNRLTMNAVDRLVGITMPRAGISQVVSVDLEQAEAFAES